MVKSLIGVLFFCLSISSFAHEENAPLFLVRVKAKTAKERSRIANAGVAIDQVFSDSVTFLGTNQDITNVKRAGFTLSAQPLNGLDRAFPASDTAFHDYNEVVAIMDGLAKSYPNIVTRTTLGKSLEGRELPAIRISAEPKPDTLPTAIFLGCHHAREHLSVEVPLKLAQYLTSEYYANNARVQALLKDREVWIAPLVNADGAEYDIASGNYKYWRKNRKANGNGTYGVDLNRNYGGVGWGGEGSSDQPSSDIYHGTGPFSEPETQAVRDFVRARKNATVLLTYHTFSELILWPWGHTEDKLSNAADLAAFEKMGKKMATWNHYTPEQSSDLYVASGDTTDWAYDELKIFAFTFELSPRSLFSGGFYPGASAIEPTFKANLEPALYLIDMAAHPYQ